MNSNDLLESVISEQCELVKQCTTLDGASDDYGKVVNSLCKYQDIVDRINENERQNQKFIHEKKQAFDSYNLEREKIEMNESQAKREHYKTVAGFILNGIEIFGGGLLTTICICLETEHSFNNLTTRELMKNTIFKPITNKNKR